jgi:hypothetical protein
VVWLLVVGVEHARQVIGDLVATQPGRRLPLPGPGSVEGQVLIASCLAVVATLIAGLRARARDRGGLEATTLLGLGLFALALIPPTIQRADTAHLLFLACVALAPLPAVLVEGHRGWTQGSVWMPALAGFSGLVALGAVAHASGPALKDLALGGDSAAYAVSVGDRSFSISDRAAADDLGVVLARLDSLATPGDSLFVGTDDLTRSNYNDVFVYYLFPDLRPASRFTEFDPQTANAEDSGLATQLESADFIVRTSRYDDWDEPNASDERGPTAPDDVVARDFRLVDSHGTYELLQRRDG